ncbi:MAG: nucleotidyltransferase family protein [Acidobacteriota bacterium]
MRVSGVLLAAGASTRFGSPKMLAPMGEEKEPLLRKVIGTWLGAGFDDVIVVLGCGAADIRATFEENEDFLRSVKSGEAAAGSVRFVENSEWQAGMFSSVKAGLRATSAGSTHVAISPADIPFLSKSSLRTILSAATSLDAGGFGLAVPTHGGRRGHPLLIPAALRARLLSWPDSARLNQLFQEPDVTVHCLEGFDDSILHDVDRPEDLQKPTARRSSSSSFLF